MDYSTVSSIWRHIKDYIKGLRVSGSFKRKEELINDLDIITKRDIHSIVIEMKDYYDVDVLEEGSKFARLKFNFDGGHINIDIWRAMDKYDYFYKCLLRDLDKGHSIYWKKQALKYNYHLSDNGLKNSIGQYVNIMSRKELKRLLKIK